MVGGSGNHVESRRQVSKLSDYLVRVIWVPIYAVVLFASAGRLDLPLFWVYLLAYWGLTLSGGVLMMKRQPGLAQERLRPGPGAKEKFSVLLLQHHATWLAILAIAGLDVGRFRWSGDVSLALQIVALLAFCLATALAVSTIILNPFASSVVRVQLDRDQYVVTSGPYRWVRHPMYLGCILMGPLAAITLGSWYAILPSLLSIGAVIRRTDREDRLLLAELEGYTQYSQRVRYRLVPGIW